MLFVIFFIILYLPITLLFPTKIIHKERLPKKKKAILTSNHYSNLDPIIYDIKFCAKFRFMAKAELFKIFFISSLIKSAGAYPVDRENVSPSVFKTTLNLLKNNKQVFIFPEGTRNKTGKEDMENAKSGVITFASKSETEIIPMLMYRPPKIFRKNYIIVGEPFKLIAENTKKLNKDELQNNLQRYENVVKSLRLELEEKILKKNVKKK